MQYNHGQPAVMKTIFRILIGAEITVPTVMQQPHSENFIVNIKIISLH